MSEQRHDGDDTDVYPVPTPLVLPAQAAAYLIVLASVDGTGKMFRLDPGERIIGRAPDAHIRLDSPGVSRHHVRLVCHADGAVDLFDLGSTNGTWVQGERVRERRLREGDKLQVGNTVILKLSYQDPLDVAFQETLYTSATRDGMTGVFNARYFHEALQREFSFCARHGLPLSLVLLDVDHFKGVNDTWGHLAGDFVLERLGELLQGQGRSEDVLARVGGEEFGWLLREVPHPQALTFAERVRGQVAAAAFVTRGTQLPITVSLGVATLSGRSHGSPEALLEAADRALYAAKGAGRNRVGSAAPRGMPGGNEGRG